MDKYFKEEYIKERFYDLPKIIQDILMNSGWENKLNKIGSDNKLRIDQLGILERELLYVMLGIDNEEDLIENLKKEASIDSTTAIRIQRAIVSDILAPMSQKIVAATSANKSSFEKVETIAENNIEPREEILKQIEEVDNNVMVTPQEKKGNPIISNRMSQPVVAKQEKTDTPQPQPVDPYRESIE